MAAPGVLTLSHVGIYVANLPVMLDFYERVMGFTLTDRGFIEAPTGRAEIAFLSRDPNEHHQLVLATGRPQALDFNPINQISIRANSLATLRDYHSRAAAEALVSDIQPITHGNAISVYFRDPEGNRIELFIDTPWYVNQPLRVSIDLSLPDAELLQQVEAHARSLPGFRSRESWISEMATRMGTG